MPFQWHGCLKGSLIKCSTAQEHLWNAPSSFGCSPLSCLLYAKQWQNERGATSQVLDGFFVKYLASAVALVVYAAPIYFRDPARRGDQESITQDYIRAMRLLQNTSKSAPSLWFIHSPHISGRVMGVPLLIAQSVAGRVGRARFPPMLQGHRGPGADLQADQRACGAHLPRL